MEVRKFLPGDRVQQKKGGPVMEVIKYVTERDILTGTTLSDTNVECVWFDEGNRHTGVYDQTNLFKVTSKSGLFKT
jgi:uncharacterized protein YodC (DUF2158 family)